MTTADLAYGRRVIWRGLPATIVDIQWSRAPRVQIKIAGGRVRVLRLAAIGRHCLPLRYTVFRGRPMCRVCGCTNRFGCPGGCQWVDSTRDLCSRCVKRSVL